MDKMETISESSLLLIREMALILLPEDDSDVFCVSTYEGQFVKVRGYTFHWFHFLVRHIIPKVRFCKVVQDTNRTTAYVNIVERSMRYSITPDVFTMTLEQLENLISSLHVEIMEMTQLSIIDYTTEEEYTSTMY